MREWVDKVLAESDLDPRFYTTSVAMDDLDDVRQALGYDKINLYGHSYGATAAQYYLRQHEDHVRTVILSGGTLLDIPIVDVWARNGQRALDLIWTRCEADSACHQAFPNIRAEFAALMARLDQKPVTEQFTNPADQTLGSVILTRDFFAENLRTMTLDADDAASVPRLIHHAYADNDWSGITAYYLKHGPGDWGPQFMEHVILCSEKWAAFSPESVARASEGSYLQGWDVQKANEHALGCQYTPKGETPEGTAPQPHSLVPVLLLNGEADPQDPPENVAGSKELWPNSLVLVEPFMGHVTSDYPTEQCRWAIENEFIQSGSVKGLHTDCLQKIRAPAFDTRP